MKFSLLLFVLACLLAAACSSAAVDTDSASAPATGAENSSATTDSDADTDDSAIPEAGDGTDGQGEGEQEDGGEGDAVQEVAAESEDDDEPFAGLDDDYLFSQDELHTFELDLSEDDLAFLDADPAAEEYVEGTLTFEGETIPVGIRYKGSIGAFARCLDGPNPFLAEGAKTCPKLSMKIKINWEDSKDEFLGVRKLQFHAMNNDDSQLRERLGYWLWREMDVAAPRATNARVVINGEFSGLYALVENIDGRFTRANFDDGKGNLYKEVWPVTLDGEPFDEEVYIDSLRTNEDEDPTAELVRAFATDLGAVADDAERAAVVREYMDVDRLMNQLAVDRTILHDDGPFHWYCIGDVARLQGCDPHNFFWYEETDSGQLHMIPWDIDNAFADSSTIIGGFITVADALGEITDDCEPFPFGSFNIPQLSASCDPLFAAWATMTDDYLAAFDRLHAGPLRSSVIDPLLDTWVAQIEAATIEAAEANSQALNVTTWETAVDQLRATVDSQRENRPR